MLKTTVITVKERWHSLAVFGYSCEGKTPDAFFSLQNGVRFLFLLEFYYEYKGR